MQTPLRTFATKESIFPHIRQFMHYLGSGEQTALAWINWQKKHPAAPRYLQLRDKFGSLKQACADVNEYDRTEYLAPFEETEKPARIYRGSAEKWTWETVIPVMERFVQMHPDKRERTSRAYRTWSQAQGKAAPSDSILHLKFGGFTKVLQAISIDSVPSDVGIAANTTASKPSSNFVRKVSENIATAIGPGKNLSSPVGVSP
jgi:hypothetical protein